MKPATCDGVCTGKSLNEALLLLLQTAFSASLKGRNRCALCAVVTWSQHTPSPFLSSDLSGLHEGREVAGDGTRGLDGAFEGTGGVCASMAVSMAACISDIVCVCVCMAACVSDIYGVCGCMRLKYVNFCQI